MKRLVSLLLVLVLIAAVFTGCSSPAEDDPVDTPPVEDENGEEVEEPVDEPAEGEIVKLGLGQNISIASSKEKAEDQDALSQANVTMAAVGFDADGKVVSVTIDTVQAKVAFDEEMNITSDIEAEVKLKKIFKMIMV